MDTPSPLFYVALIAYGIAAVGFAASIWSNARWVRFASWAAIIVGFLAHGGDISTRAMDNLHPGSSIRESIGFIGFVLTAVFLFFGWRYKVIALGAFVAPVSMMLLAVARFTSSGSDSYPVLMRVHIALASIGVAILATATAVGTLYILKDRALRHKNFDGFWYQRAAPLDTLDRVNHRLVLLGFPIFSIAVMLGAISAARAGVGWGRPEYPFALLTWFALGFVAIARTTHGWRGRKASWAIIVGFLAAVVVLGIYLLRRLA